MGNFLLTKSKFGAHGFNSLPEGLAKIRPNWSAKLKHGVGAKAETRVLQVNEFAECPKFVNFQCCVGPLECMKFIDPH